MLDYIPLKQSFFRDSRIIKLLIDNRHREIIIILRIVLMMIENIETKEDKKPQLEIDDFEILAYRLNESTEIVEKIFNEKIFFDVMEEDSKIFITSEYTDDFYKSLKENSDRQRTRRRTKNNTEKDNDTQSKVDLNNDSKSVSDSNTNKLSSTSKATESPTLEEIRKYCESKGYTKNDYNYESNYDYVKSCKDWKKEIESFINLKKYQRNRENSVAGFKT